MLPILVFQFENDPLFCGKTLTFQLKTTPVSLSSIQLMEIFPIAVALSMWVHMLQNKKMVFNNDNQGVTEILSSQSSKCSQIMIIVHFIVLSSLKHNFLFRALHAPGISNVYCDQLSRGRIKEFKEGCPHARQDSDNIPLSVWQI